MMTELGGGSMVLHWGGLGAPEAALLAEVAPP